MTKQARALLAQETVAIVERGNYLSRAGRVVEIADDVRECIESTRSYSPSELNSLRRKALAATADAGATRFEVVNETTLAGIARVLADGTADVAALNFASARNPGGGFLNGAVAQEESLARSSALYASLLTAGEFYDGHRQSPSLLYSDAMIVAPACPIFRDDAGNLLDDHHRATFITSPAPNAGAIRSHRSTEEAQVATTIARRAELILAVAAWHGARTLILGAWGCGVFRNDSEVVAAAFAGPLRDGLWAGRFERVVFSVLDPSPLRSIIGPFEAAFA